MKTKKIKKRNFETVTHTLKKREIFYLLYFVLEQRASILEVGSNVFFAGDIAKKFADTFASSWEF